MSRDKGQRPISFTDSLGYKCRAVHLLDIPKGRIGFEVATDRWIRDDEGNVFTSTPRDGSAAGGRGAKTTPNITKVQVWLYAPHTDMTAGIISYEQERELVRVFANMSMAVQPASNDAPVLWLGRVFTGSGKIQKPSPSPRPLAFWSYASSTMMPTREVWPLMVEAAALANRKNDLIASHSKGEEDVDETRLPEGVVPKFYGTMLAQLSISPSHWWSGARLLRTLQPSILSYPKRGLNGDVGSSWLHGCRVLDL
jgi:hypothetical protein